MPDRRVRDLTGRKLFVGTPMYDGRCHSEFAFAMVQLSALCMQLGVELRCFFACHEALIAKARNITVDEFLRSDCGHLMFIDSDIGFDARDVIQLLAIQAGAADEQGLDVLAAPYPLKRMSWEPVLRAAKLGLADNDAERLADVASGIAVHPAQEGAFAIRRPLEVTQAGTGFMLVRRATFERLHRSGPLPTYRPWRVGLEQGASDEIVAFFETEIDGKQANLAAEIREFVARHPACSAQDVLDFVDSDATMAAYDGHHVSEDYAFCRAVRRAGMSVWLCPWMELSHTGSYRFTSRLTDLAAIGRL